MKMASKTGPTAGIEFCSEGVLFPPEGEKDSHMELNRMEDGLGALSRRLLEAKHQVGVVRVEGVWFWRRWVGVWLGNKFIRCCCAGSGYSWMGGVSPQVAMGENACFLKHACHSRRSLWDQWSQITQADGRDDRHVCRLSASCEPSVHQGVRTHHTQGPLPYAALHPERSDGGTTEHIPRGI